MSKLKSAGLFQKKKAVIGLVHFKALPGDPKYDEEG